MIRTFMGKERELSTREKILKEYEIAMQNFNYADEDKVDESIAKLRSIESKYLQLFGENLK